MAELDGPGVATEGLARICIAIATCGAITKGTGVVSEATGTCGAETIITRRLDGSGAGIAESVATCIACGSCEGGMALDGITCAVIGICTEKIITITDSMDGIVGFGDGSVALECTSTGCEHCSGITRVTGAACVPIGICGDEISTTSDHSGAGASTNGLAITCIDYASCSGGLVRDGAECEATGTCGAAITTVIDRTGAPAGFGVGIVGSEHTSTAGAFCREITMAIGEMFVLTGLFGERIITTEPTGGSGVENDASGTIYTACAF